MRRRVPAASIDHVASLLALRFSCSSSQAPLCADAGYLPIVESHNSGA
ncbi:hypothetical protein [Devosia sp.]